MDQSLTAHGLAVGPFARGLSNLKAMLIKAEAHAAANRIDQAELLRASIAAESLVRDVPRPAAADLHFYPLSAHVHWAAEGARLAVARLLQAPRVPAVNDATTFEHLHHRIDSTLDYFRTVAPSDLEASLDRAIVVEHRHGAIHSSGERFLVGYAIPHFFYHVTTAYGILRNQGVQLTMGDFLGDWGAPNAESDR